jgi:hypothetical protein
MRFTETQVIEEGLDRCPNGRWKPLEHLSLQTANAIIAEKPPALVGRRVIGH